MTTQRASFADAQGDADAGAHRSAAIVREMTAVDLSRIQGVIAHIWGPQQTPQSNLLQALVHAGNPVLVALRGDQPVGAALGFLGWREGIHLHSHMAGVVNGSESHGIGLALKLAQRSACLRSGITEMRWTFDPLVARNAHFNLIKLGARVRAFHPDFYGDMDDVVNSGDNSDRFEVTWRLDAALPTATSPSAPTGGSHARVSVRVPADYLALRRADPDAARAARESSSEAFGRLFGEGLLPSWTAEGYVFSGPPGPDVKGAADG